jgi:hypothetical protein
MSQSIVEGFIRDPHGVIVGLRAKGHLALNAGDNAFIVSA